MHHRSATAAPERTDRLCDALLDELGADAEDDIALLVLRVS